jgi:hypothetical protein
MSFLNLFRMYIDQKQSTGTHPTIDAPLAQQVLPVSEVMKCVCKETIAICSITSIPFPVPCVCKENIAAHPLGLSATDNKLQNALESTTPQETGVSSKSQLRRRITGIASTASGPPT